jgi:hypothetical protein
MTSRAFFEGTELVARTSTCRSVAQATAVVWLLTPTMRTAVRGDRPIGWTQEE